MTAIEQLIQEFPNEDWNIEHMLVSTELSSKFLNNNLDWKKNGVHTYHIGKKYKGKVHIRYIFLSLNRYLQVEFIDKYENYDWNFYFLSRNYNLTLEFIEKYVETKLDFEIIENKSLLKNSKDERVIKKLKNVNLYSHLKLEEITKSFEHWCKLHTNENLTLDFVEKNIDKNFCWYELTHHKCITIDFIKLHMDKGWDFNIVIKSKEISLNFIRENPVQFISIFWFDNPYMTLDFYYENIGRYGDPVPFSKYGKFNLEDIEKYPVDFDSLSENENLTYDIIRKYKDRIDFEKLSKNPLTLQNKLNRINVLKKTILPDDVIDLISSYL